MQLRRVQLSNILVGFLLLLLGLPAFSYESDSTGLVRFEEIGERPGSNMALEDTS
jgi:hypothetical protein